MFGERRDKPSKAIFLLYDNDNRKSTGRWTKTFPEAIIGSVSATSTVNLNFVLRLPAVAQMPVPSFINKNRY
jgi:hypothetical protein